MKLTVLGSSASYPDAGRACAGYLITTDAASVLLDCGNGALSKLGFVADPTGLDAVFITHEHIDHFADVYALQAALRYAPAGPIAPVPLWLPGGLFTRMGSVLSDHGSAELLEAFEAHDLVEGEPVTVGDLCVTPMRVDHTESTYALVVSDGASRLCYTADTRLGDAVVRAAAGSSILLCDATLPAEYAGRAPHMTPAEAGELASRSGAATLVLTHLWPTVDREQAVREAAGRFDGRVIVAEELTRIAID